MMGGGRGRSAAAGTPGSQQPRNTRRKTSSACVRNDRLRPLRDMVARVKRRTAPGFGF